MSSKSLAESQEKMLELLTVLAHHLSGDLTLNQIRVLQFINLCSRFRNEATRHTEICTELGLPSATVTRAVGKFIETRMVAEKSDPDDGRRRLVVGTGVIPGSNQRLDIEVAEVMGRMANSTVKVPAAESVDQESIAQSQERVGEMFTIIAGNLSGDLTLNQIRVLQFINLCWRHRSVASTGHTEMCSALQMPSATVSRAVAKFIEAGWVGEKADPADGRRRLVVSTGHFREVNPDDLDLLLAQFADRQAGTQS
jgi:DNA-binding MarR family transcriptional regulator